MDISLHEEVTVTVNNHEEEIPKIEKTTDNKEVSNKRILPVTGM